MSFSSEPPLLRWGVEDSALPRRELRLASRSLPWDGGALRWDDAFDDEEDAAALHRFAWLLPELLDWSRAGFSSNAAWSSFREHAADWARHYPEPVASLPWQSYTVSERLVNWTIASLAIGGSLRDDEELWTSIHKQADHLRANLEYHGESLTGNHLSNNGRALYFAGLACRQQTWTDDGRRILLHERARIFDDVGFLREGSSHYQFLLTRNYCEALWAARRAGDHETAEALAPSVARMAESCRFFMVPCATSGWRIPYFGDISPDCAPEYLMGVPWIASQLAGTTAPKGQPPARGWHELFSCAGASEQAISDAPTAKPSAWARVDACGWTLLAHVNPDGFPLGPSHAHQDTGGLVAYYRGEEVLIDAGRCRYGKDPVAQWGISAWAHSTLLVEGREPGLRWRRVYPPQFVARHAGSRPLLQSQHDSLYIQHGGFSRVPDVGEAARSVIAGDGMLSGVDDVGGAGRHRLDLVFQLAGNAVLEGSGIRLEGRTWKAIVMLPPDLIDVKIWSAPSDEEGFGWRSTRYGEKAPSTTVVAGGDVMLPWRGKWSVRMVA